MAALLVGTLFVTVAVAIPLTLAVVLTIGVGATLSVGLWSYGSAQVRVTASDGGWLSAHRARIESRHLGAVVALDADQTRRVAGRDADPRAFLLLRPYARGAVRVEITDPQDPAPYWLVSSRRPESLASAIGDLTLVENG